MVVGKVVHQIVLYIDVKLKKKNKLGKTKTKDYLCNIY
jgi:hypothetical protein